ncbi:SgrR family transcriptional regulator [Franconibacter pulveris]|nr:SgrR family transcriptional regulator [Franconibacter pulveris]
MSRLARQYERLLKQYQNRRCDVLLQDVAEVLACTPRYTRTLLKEMKQRGWINWSSLPGRGKISQIQCMLDENGLKEKLHPRFSSPHTSASESVVFSAAPEGYHFTLSSPRPIPAIVPAFFAVHYRRHLMRMVHVGVMRFPHGCTDPVPALAHHNIKSDDGLSWRFYIRQGLVWHNEQSVSAAQLLSQLQRLAGTPLLPYVERITANDQLIVFHLTQPDEMLLHRLAHPACSLAHPEEPTVGLGPFRVIEHTDECVKLARFAFWYGEKPLAATVTVETQLRRADDWGLINMETPRSKLRAEPVNTLSSADIFSFMTFNQLKRAALTPPQRALVLHIARSIAQSTIEAEADILPVPDWLTLPSASSFSPAPLPPSLSMAYLSTPDTDKFADALARNLSRRGCRLVLTPIYNGHWHAPGKNWEHMDIALGYLSSRREAVFTVEERWRHSRMVKAFWPVKTQRLIGAMLQRSAMGDVSHHRALLIRLLRHAIRHEIITPLYLKNFTLRYPDSVQGVKCGPQCMPDYTSLWIDTTRC